MQANPAAGSSGSFAPPAPYGRPKRGTPAYAAAVRRQIERLAAMHAASIVASPGRPAAVQSVMLVTGCERLRAAVRAALHGLPAVQLQMPCTTEDARAQLRAGVPQLLLVDQGAQALLAEAPTARAALIADVVPRSSDLPSGLVGVMARSASTERFARQLHDLLGFLNSHS